MNENLKNIIHWLISQNIIESQEDLAAKIGGNSSYLSQVVNGKKPLSVKLIDKIASLSGDINPLYLSGDSTEMTRKSTSDELLPLGPPNVAMVPLVSKYAYAGYVCGFGDAEYVDTLPTVPFFIPEEQTVKGVYTAFEVKGDSMDDGSDASIKDGDMLMCRLIHRELWTNYKLHLRKWNFVIVHKEGILVKRITDHNVTSGTIRIHSLNDLYPDKILHLNDVYQIFNVVQLQRKPLL